MTAYWSDPFLDVYQGDCRAVMAELPAESVHTVVTSPPYWGLRDYGTDGQLGLEQTPEQYVAAMVEVFREVRRVLRADGTVWLNLGDSYANDTKWGGQTTGKHAKSLHGKTPLVRAQKTTGLKAKDLVGIPWRVAFALQADGWYLRSDIIWSKPNPMPESVTDRPTKSHEYVFMLSKSARYYFDADAVREADSGQDHARARLDGQPSLAPPGQQPHTGIRTLDGRNGSGRNLRSVWTIDYNDVEWTSAIGSCRKCGGLRVAGLGPEPTTSKATGASRHPANGRDRASSERIESPTSFWSDQSDQDSPSTTSVAIGAASTPPISSPSASATTSTEATPPPLATLPRLDARRDTNTPTPTLIDALTASGSAVCVCEMPRGDDAPLSSVWRVATQPYPGAHFATFPRKLVEPCIKAGTSERGVCPECGAPWRREAERDDPDAGRYAGRYRLELGRMAQPRLPRGNDPIATRITTGWARTCEHGGEPIPATVIDPFAGSGTTALVAQALGRRAILIDLSTDYLDQIMARNAQMPLGA